MELLFGPDGKLLHLNSRASLYRVVAACVLVAASRLFVHMFIYLLCLFYVYVSQYARCAAGGGGGRRGVMISRRPCFVRGGMCHHYRHLCVSLVTRGSLVTRNSHVTRSSLATKGSIFTRGSLITRGSLVTSGSLVTRGSKACSSPNSWCF